jgi:hypothetical protein
MKKNDFLRLSCAAQMRMARIIVLVVCLLCVATYNIHAQRGYMVTGTVVGNQLKQFRQTVVILRLFQILINPLKPILPMIHI